MEFDCRICGQSSIGDVSGKQYLFERIPQPGIPGMSVRHGMQKIGHMYGSQVPHMCPSHPVSGMSGICCNSEYSEAWLHSQCTDSLENEGNAQDY